MSGSESGEAHLTLTIDLFARTLRDVDVPAGLDPLSYWLSRSDAEIEQAVLPKRPDRSQDVELFDQWTDMLDGAEALRNFSFDATYEPPGSSVTPIAPSPIETSRNWSGARVAATAGATFNRVAGRWEAPNPRKAALVDGRKATCSVWVGLDGHRRWSSAMPQIGTLHIAGVNNTDPDQHTAWVQWWVRGIDPMAEPRIKPRPLALPVITHGDVVLCWIELIRDVEANFFIRKQGDPTLYRTTIVMDGAPGPVPGAAARGLAAEWIVERPRDPGPPPVLYPLANFRSVRFTRCVAGTAQGQKKLEACHLIRMIERRQMPERTTVISKPRRQGQSAGRLLVTYTG